MTSDASLAKPSGKYWATLSLPDPDSGIMYEKVRTRLSIVVTRNISARYKALRLIVVAEENQRFIVSPSKPTAKFPNPGSIGDEDGPPSYVRTEEPLTLILKFYRSRHQRLISIPSPSELSKLSTNQLVILLDQQYHPQDGSLSHSIDLHNVMLPDSYEYIELDPMNWFHQQHIITLTSTHSDDVTASHILPRLPSSIIEHILVHTDSNPEGMISWTRSIKSLLPYTLISTQWRKIIHNTIRTEVFSGKSVDFSYFSLAWFHGLIHLALKDPTFCRTSLFRLPSAWQICARPTDDLEAFSTPFNRVLRVATNVRTLDLYSLVVTRSIEPLRRLEKVQKLSIQGKAELFSEEWDPEDPSLSLSTTFDCIRNWKELKVLEIERCMGQSDPEDITTEASYSLIKLHLIGGFIPGPQLLCAISRSTGTLQEVTLDGIDGLTRTDFSRFFENIARCLKVLTVYGCELEDGEIGELDSDGVFPLDAVIHEMTEISEIRIQSNLASTISIANAPTPSIHSSSSSKFLIGPYPTDSITSEFMTDLTNAIRRTAWRVVYLIIEDFAQFDGVDGVGGMKGVLDPVYKAAEQSGVRFRIRDGEWVEEGGVRSDLCSDY